MGHRFSLARHSTDRRSLKAGETLFRQGDTVDALYEVVSGALTLVRHGPAGAELTLQRAETGEIIAESSLFSDVYHCDCLCERDALLIRMKRADLTAAMQQDAQLALSFAALLAGNARSLRRRMALLSLPRLAERLNAWLDWEEERTGCRPDVTSGLIDRHWTQVAGELNVTPPALYRELSRRRKALHQSR